MIKKLSLPELSAGRNVMKQCLGVKPGESVLIVIDPTRLDLVGIFATAAKEITDKVEVVSITGMTENAQEPPKDVAQKMLEADVALLVTTYSLSHTQARKKACKAGCRIASMPGITQDMILRTLSINYQKIALVSKKLAVILTAGKEARVTSANGTNLIIDISGRIGQADTGLILKPGDVSNLPAGEGFIAPIENKTDGIFVIDGAIADIKLDRPIIIEFKKGKAEKISGGQAAAELERLINQVGSKARIIAELGIGTNPAARLCPEILEAEKVFATVHIALGNSATIGGKNQVAFHSDGIIKTPTLTVDGKTIVKDNKIIV